MPSYSIGQAARLLGVSSETVRRRADSGRLLMDREGPGNRAIDGVSLAAFAKERGAGAHPLPGRSAVTSVRNAFTGIVTRVTLDDIAAQVEVQSGPHRIVSLVTRESVEELGIQVGVTVTARVKSTNVHVDTPRCAAVQRMPDEVS
ncbi:TOBE domain-containing protein [Streptomyces luteolus]|uniref:TOBE domain-containing protein n=1 Tax=Streptomyces luteolus TaxID=3043615 RepID=A0ABT6SVI2_9ACTN|nr:TOBE domain-containing protein [Streptomyces sp. B-S-A12]MDI3419123.1 TOBE domain-containing protein [Streptomyces sp. B-S-A12]